MKPTPTSQNFTDNPSLVNPFLAKLAKKIAHEWDDSDWGAAAMQVVLDADIPATDIKAYSAVLTEAQINENVPAGWPGNMITPMLEAEVPATYDEEGEEITPYVPPVYGEERLKTWREYTYAIEVTGGYVLRFTKSPVHVWYDPADASMRQNGAINVDTDEFKIWVNRFGGFNTHAWMLANRVTEPIE